MSAADLHGNAPDKSPVALLLIDVLNDLEFDGGAQLLTPALAMADTLRVLKQRAAAAGVPCVYVNDNFGRWRSSTEQLVAHHRDSGKRGSAVVQRLLPAAEDYFVLKPKHSGFYATPLEVLLEHLGARRLIMTGLTTNGCVLFTAGDAYLRGYELCVPPDGVAAIEPADHRWALAHMQRQFHAELLHAADIPFEDWKAGAGNSDQRAVVPPETRTRQ